MHSLSPMSPIPAATLLPSPGQSSVECDPSAAAFVALLDPLVGAADLHLAFAGTHSLAAGPETPVLSAADDVLDAARPDVAVPGMTALLVPFVTVVLSVPAVTGARSAAAGGGTCGTTVRPEPQALMANGADPQTGAPVPDAKDRSQPTPAARNVASHEVDPVPAFAPVPAARGGNAEAAVAAVVTPGLPAVAQGNAAAAPQGVAGDHARAPDPRPTLPLQPARTGPATVADGAPAVIDDASVTQADAPPQPQPAALQQLGPDITPAAPLAGRDHAASVAELRVRAQVGVADPAGDGNADSGTGQSRTHGVPLPAPPKVPVLPPVTKAVAPPVATPAQIASAEHAVPRPDLPDAVPATPPTVRVLRLIASAAPDTPIHASPDPGVPTMAPSDPIVPDAPNMPVMHAATPGAPVGQSAPAVPMVNLPQVFAVAIAADPGQPVEVRLDPPELGIVRFTVEAQERGLVVTIIADRPETLDLMRRHADQFLADLRQSGCHGASLNFGASGHDGGHGAQTPPPHRGASAPDTAAPAPASRQGTVVRGLDLRL